MQLIAMPRKCKLEEGSYIIEMHAWITAITIVSLLPISPSISFYHFSCVCNFMKKVRKEEALGSMVIIFIQQLICVRFYLYWMQFDDCTSECGGSTNNECRNPDQHEPWIRSTCIIKCASNINNVSTNTSGFSAVLEILTMHRPIMEF